METAAFLLSLRNSLGESRAQRLYGDLRFALERTDRAALKAWGFRSAGRMGLLAARRVNGVFNLLHSLFRFGGREAGDLLKALRQGDLPRHLAGRSAAAIDNTLEVGREARQMLRQIIGALLRDPKNTAPRLLAACLGFGAGSGGLDGNGGVPDLDLLFGIGHHRSPLTHTIIAGIVLEGLILALLDFSAELFDRLPHDHDPLWDQLAKVGRPVSESLSVGLSAGLAYHLFVDAFIQPAAYHDLPFSMSKEAHQATFAANAAAEATDAARRAGKAGGPRIIEMEDADKKSTGERVVASVIDTAAALGEHARQAARRLDAWTQGFRSA